MNEDQLRALIRESVARHLAGTGLAPVPPSPAFPVLAPGLLPAPGVPPPAVAGGDIVGGATVAPGSVSIASAPAGIAILAAPGAAVNVHISHATFALPMATDGRSDGPCQTEPHAGCTSCGFCQSLGY